MRVIGSLIIEGRVRPFVLESGQLRLDVYEPDASDAGERHSASGGAELQVREAAAFPIDEVRIGEYFCGSCDKWFRANQQDWSMRICLYCSLDQGTEISDYLDKLESDKPVPMPDLQKKYREVFEQAFAMAERGLLEDSIETFASVPSNAPDYRAAVFNQAVLLARIGYLADAIARFKSLGEDEDPEVQRAQAECRNAKDRGGRSTACAAVALRR